MNMILLVMNEMANRNFYQTPTGVKFIQKFLTLEADIPTADGYWIRHHKERGSWAIADVEMLSETTARIDTGVPTRWTYTLKAFDANREKVTYTGPFKELRHAAEYRKAFQPSADVVRSLARNMERVA
jgi:hypothetical protein